MPCLGMPVKRLDGGLLRSLAIKEVAFAHKVSQQARVNRKVRAVLPVAFNPSNA